MTKAFVTIMFDGWEVEEEPPVHAMPPGVGLGADYQTLCGLSEETILGQNDGEVRRASKGKITCSACKQIWLVAKQYTERDFKVPSLRGT